MRRIGIKPEDRPVLVKGNEPRKKIIVLSDDHANRLMKAAIADQDQRLWLFVAFGLNTAMRHSEILRVRYDQIDFDTRRIFIPHAKAGEREQPITVALASILKKQRDIEDDADHDGYVFPCRSARAKHPHRISMAVSFQRAVVRADLLPDKVTPHVMRHTAITRLVKAGVDLPTIQKISGHKTAAMVLRYVHIHGQHIDDAIAAIDMGFSDSITPELHTPSVATRKGEGTTGARKSQKTGVQRTVVRTAGLEPALRRKPILSRLRLPISPRPPTIAREARSRPRRQVR